MQLRNSALYEDFPTFRATFINVIASKDLERVITLIFQLVEDFSEILFFVTQIYFSDLCHFSTNCYSCH